MKLQLAEEMDSNGAVEHEALEELDTADLDSSAPDDGSAAKKAKASCTVLEARLTFPRSSTKRRSLSMYYVSLFIKIAEQPKPYIPQPAQHERVVSYLQVSHPLMLGL